MTTGDIRELITARLVLEPLRPAHADEMQPVLDDPNLHTFIGGAPATLDELRARYTRMAVGRSDDRSQRWLNWMLRRRDGTELVGNRLVANGLVGTVQATVLDEDGVTVAEVAWVIGADHQGNGYATEAARAMVDAVRHDGVQRVVAHVHPDHAASIAVARAVGLAPTDIVVDGEIRWQG